MLYDPAAYEPLTEELWNEARARDGIAAIAADIDAAFHADALWPAHEWDGYQAQLPLKNLYVGAAGMVFALTNALQPSAAYERFGTVFAVVIVGGLMMVYVLFGGMIATTNRIEALDPAVGRPGRFD